MIRYQMEKRPQLNLTPPKDLLERLGELAKLYKKDERRKNEIAIEVLETYLPFWEDAASAHSKLVKSQRRAARERGLRMLKEEAVGESGQIATVPKAEK